MLIGIDASQANKKERTGTEWYAYYIIEYWMRKNVFQSHEVRLYVREPLSPDFPKIPENWEVKILRWPPKILWTQVRLSFQLLFHPVEALFIPAHAIPFKHPKKTFTTIHDIGFESKKHVYGSESVVRVSSPIIKKLLSLIVRALTLGRYGANELDYQRFSVRQAIKHAYGIFTVSRFSEREIKAKFPTHPPLYVAYNGIDHETFYYPFDKKEIERIKKLYAVKNYCLALGRIERKKNSLELVKGFHRYIEKYKNFDTDLVFAGSKGLGADEVEDYIKLNKLGNRVKVLGWINQEDIPGLIAGSSLFMQLSEYEGFGVPVIQALALGTPVLANKLEVFEEIAPNAVWYCNAHDHKEIADQIYKILSADQDTLVTRQKEGFKVAKNFTWEKTATQIAERMLA